MTVYVYPAGVPGEEAKELGVIALLGQHKRRYLFRTGKGDIVLRHLPHGLERIIDGMMLSLYPTSGRDAAELGDLLGKGDLDDESRRRVEELSVRLERPSLLYALGVVESPRLAYEEDVYELMGNLTADEERVFREWVVTLSGVDNVAQMDDLALDLAAKHGVEIVDRELLVNMTVSQAELFAHRLLAEKEAMDALMGGDRVVRV